MPLHRCPFCHKLNQPSSTFCIHCGEPFDEDSLALPEAFPVEPEFPKTLSRPEPVPASGDFLAYRGKIEFLLGLALLLGIASFGLYNAARNDDLAAHYRAGLAGVVRQDYDTALREFGQATGYRDTDKQVAGIREQLSLRDSLYTQARTAIQQGEWKAAASDLRRVVSIQSDYRDAAELLSRIHTLTGIVLYRDGPYRSLYIAEAGGGNVLIVPGTDARTQVKAVSSDSEWVLYSIPGPGGQAVYLYSVIASISRQLRFPITGLPEQVAARFAPGNDVVWVQADDNVYYFEIPAPYDARSIDPRSRDVQSLGGEPGRVSPTPMTSLK